MLWRECPSLHIDGYRSRVFQCEVEDGHLSVFVGQEPLGPQGALRWHLSISHRSNALVNSEGHPLPGRLPTWEEMKEARYKFCPDQLDMALILPPTAEYVNLHPTTMHLHEVDR